MNEDAFPVEDWLLNLPLYSPVQLGADIYEAIEAILLFAKTVDYYCPGCQQNATFMGLVSVGADKIRREEQRLVNVNRLAMVAGAAI